jgi:hypothetical protein
MKQVRTKTDTAWKSQLKRSVEAPDPMLMLWDPLRAMRFVVMKMES